MKITTSIATLFVVFALPLSAGAHTNTSDDFSEIGHGPGMMHYIEDRAVGDEQHEEMETLMIKMMGGTLTEAEADRFAELINEYPGPYALMMQRFDPDNDGISGMYNGYGHHMMDAWGSGGAYGGHLFFSVAAGVWLIVGLLFIAWLIRQLGTKKESS